MLKDFAQNLNNKKISLIVNKNIQLMPTLIVIVQEMLNLYNLILFNVRMNIN